LQAEFEQNKIRESLLDESSFMPDNVHKMEKDNDKFEFSSYGDNSAMHSRLSAGGVSMIRGINPLIES
jgi:hypothetical protein